MINVKCEAMQEFSELELLVQTQQMKWVHMIETVRDCKGDCCYNLLEVVVKQLVYKHRDLMIV